LKTCYSRKYKQKIRVTIENRKKKKIENLYELHGCEVTGTIMAIRKVKKNTIFALKVIVRERKGEQNNCSDF